MKLAIFLAFIGISYGAIVDSEWEQFKVTYGRRYNGLQEKKAYEAFRTNLNKINAHNDLYELGLSSFKLGLNEYSDKTAEQMAHRNGLKINYPLANRTRHSLSEISLNDLPTSVDWRKKGAVTSIKNQEPDKCGSCWAFSAIGTIEGAHAINTGNLVDLSVQNVVDCDSQADGCGGGFPDWAFQYVISNKGVDTSKSYPYHAVDQQCQFKSANVGATISSYVDLAQTEAAIQKAVATIQPISVAIDATSDAFNNYKSGIFDIDDCTTMLTHAVLIVGYGTENGKDYWIIKNSYGTSWGEKGYMKMVRGKNMCGINLQGAYVVV